MASKEENEVTVIFGDKKYYCKGREVGACDYCRVRFTCATNKNEVKVPVEDVNKSFLDYLFGDRLPPKFKKLKVQEDDNGA